jgi:hypothetical protein
VKLQELVRIYIDFAYFSVVLEEGEFGSLKAQAFLFPSSPKYDKLKNVFYLMKSHSPRFSSSS